MPNNINRLLSTVTFACLTLVGCGGGGGDSTTGATTTGGSTPSTTTASAYACDRAIEAAALPRTPSINFAFAAPAATTPTLVQETWSLPVEGFTEQINVAIATPQAGVTVRGIVIVNHGISSTQQTAPPSAMVDPGTYFQYGERGYITIFVARRGNYGSSGLDRHVAASNALISRYQTRQITYADLEEGLWKLHSSPVVAVLAALPGDVRFSPYLSNIALTGASGGAETSLQVAFDSTVFRAATGKAIVRVTGKDSALDTNPEAGLGANQYGERIANNTSPSLWFGGELDTTTSLGGLACEMKFFKAASAKENVLYAVPGLTHGAGTSLAFSVTLYPYMQAFMVRAGMPGF